MVKLLFVHPLLPTIAHEALCCAAIQVRQRVVVQHLLRHRHPSVSKCLQAQPWHKQPFLVDLNKSNQIKSTKQTNKKQNKTTKPKIKVNNHVCLSTKNVNELKKYNNYKTKPQKKQNKNKT